jgi:hypothetical protein
MKSIFFTLPTKNKTRVSSIKLFSNRIKLSFLLITVQTPTNWDVNYDWLSDPLSVLRHRCNKRAPTKSKKSLNEKYVWNVFFFSFICHLFFRSISIYWPWLNNNLTCFLCVSFYSLVVFFALKQVKQRLRSAFMN